MTLSSIFRNWLNTSFEHFYYIPFQLIFVGKLQKTKYFPAGHIFTLLMNKGWELGGRNYVL